MQLDEMSVSVSVRWGVKLTDLRNGLHVKMLEKAGPLYCEITESALASVVR